MGGTSRNITMVANSTSVRHRLDHNETSLTSCLRCASLPIAAPVWLKYDLAAVDALVLIPLSLCENHMFGFSRCSRCPTAAYLPHLG